MNLVNLMKKNQQVKYKFPMLMKESIEYVTSNLNVKTSLFAIPKLKVDTERLISDSSFGFHPSKKVFTDGGK